MTGIPFSTLGGYLSGRHLPPLRVHDQLLVAIRACGVARLGSLGSWTTAAVVTPGEDPVDALEQGTSSLDPRAARALLVVDQLEELFTRSSPARRRAFLDRLRNLVGRDASPAVPSVTVLAGLRADFYPHALREHHLSLALQQRQVVVGAMSVEELRSAIVEPAAAVGVELEEGLVETVLRDLAPQMPTGGPTDPDGAAGFAHEPGALPLMSHALLETWRRGPGERMTLPDYLAVGAISGAVAASAETVYRELDATQQDVARRLFLHLVAVEEDTADTRRRVSADELAGQAGAGPIADRFVAARLLSVDETGLQIAHEALLAAWPRLQGWLDADRAGLAVHRRLGHAAADWATGRCCAGWWHGR